MSTTLDADFFAAQAKRAVHTFFQPLQLARRILRAAVTALTTADETDEPLPANTQFEVSHKLAVVRAFPVAIAIGVGFLTVVGLTWALSNSGDKDRRSGVSAAQKVTLEGQSVTASGCIRPVEHTSCLVIRGPGGGYYDVTSMSPAPDISKGRGISLRGKDSGRNTECGRELTDVKWSYLNVQCWAPPPEAPR